MNTQRFAHLDMLRGMAALLVVGGHARGYIVDSYQNIEAQGILVKIFYFTTGLGHQAVILFFALSGFLVGGKALNMLVEGRFCWRLYVARRLTRLWIVIFPALILTYVFDRLGMFITGGLGYDGRYYAIFSSGPTAAYGAIHTLISFVGNIFFVQTVYVPIFGSNGPMWSLANEFWYYVVFPLAAYVILSAYGVAYRLVGVAVLLIAMYLLPYWLLKGGMIWVAGAVAARYGNAVRGTNAAAKRFVACLAPLLLVGALTIAKSGYVGDIVLGFTVAVTLPILASMESLGSAYDKVSRALSEISYTLYLTHFPMLTFVCLSFLAPYRQQPDAVGMVIWGGMVGLSLAWAGFVWWCFERHTDQVYGRIRGKLATIHKLRRIHLT